jgi:hypothetical protein
VDLYLHSPTRLYGVDSLHNVWMVLSEAQGQLYLLLLPYDHSLPSSAEVKECVELYLHFANTPSWRGARLKNTWTP